MRRYYFVVLRSVCFGVTYSKQIWFPFCERCNCLKLIKRAFCCSVPCSNLMAHGPVVVVFPIPVLLIGSLCLFYADQFNLLCVCSTWRASGVP